VNPPYAKPRSPTTINKTAITLVVIIDNLSKPKCQNHPIPLQGDRLAIQPLVG